MNELINRIFFFLHQHGVRRNISYFFRFLLMLTLLILLFSILFHFLMLYEDRSYSWITGLYWALTVMSTLGFGDITFTSDIGKLFSIVVLLSGLIFLVVMLPFVFTQFFYIPWLEAQKKEEIPRSVPAGTKNHILLVGTSPVVLNMVDDLLQYGTHCYLLCQDSQQALDLIDRGYHVVVGDHDDSRTYQRMAINSAAMLAALDTDIYNTSTVFSAREIAPDVRILSKVEHEASVDILELAGATNVIQFHRVLGQALARRVIKSTMRSSILTRFEHLMIAEAPLMRTALVGKSLRECSLRNRTGVNVVGVWERGNLSLPHPDAPFSPFTVLVIAGTRAQINSFDQMLVQDQQGMTSYSTVILGGGRVGLAVAEQLKKWKVEAVIVNKSGIPQNRRFDLDGVCGDAADLETLEKAGIRKASSVVITTHDDDTNIYLTLYCRRLRPDIQIISRASLDRNISVLHAAGADLVLSLASMMTMSIVNLLSPGKLVMLNEGLNIFRSTVKTSLAGKKLAESEIRSRTNCSVVAIRDTHRDMHVNPEPTFEFTIGDEMYLIGDSNAVSSFNERYGQHHGDAN